ncbi:hypothetical protein, partial [Cellulosimicrobium funkei]
AEAPREVPGVHAWRIIRWEADVPLTAEQRDALLEGVEATVAPAGAAAPRARRSAGARPAAPPPHPRGSRDGSGFAAASPNSSAKQSPDR